MPEFADTRDDSLLEASGGNIVLFHPYVPEGAIEGVVETLRSRWIGQGPKVDQFESQFATQLGLKNSPVAVGACTDAMHLSYVLCGLQPGDEVISPVFTCTATNIPLLYHGVRIRFADIQPETMNIDPGHVRSLVTERTRAIVCVHYGGLPCDMAELRAIAEEHGIPIIEDAAQALGATYHGVPVGDLSEYTAFSFQAIKHITTGDGGMLTLQDPGQLDKVRRLRWFGIDRTAKQGGTWSNDIHEVGYKYQMTDIAAAMGLAGLAGLQEQLTLRRALFAEYALGLERIAGVQLLGTGFSDREHAAWLCTVVVDDRKNLEKKLREHGIESGQVHFRNDRYSILSEFRAELPAMDALEERYLVLPLHTQMCVEDVQRICQVLARGW